LTIERSPEGKMRVTSISWDHERMFAGNQVLEVHWVDGSLHVARKERHHDEWDPPIEPYDPYGPGKSDEESVTDNSDLLPITAAVTPASETRRRCRARRHLG